MINITDIQWSQGPKEKAECRCPICGAIGKHKELLTVPHMWTGVRVSLHQCNSCNTRFYPNATESSYDDSNVASKTFLQHYLEAGAGPWEMFWPIARLYHPTKSKLLDVGCGFGFSLDMWKNIFAAEVTGVETAEWGQIGSAQFGITIHRGMLDDIPSIQGKTFDIVYACEVIEHVADPRAFLRSLSKRVGKDGILALTTPSGDFVKEGNDEKDILAALLPGGHLFLLSAQAFEQLLHDVGFLHVHVVGARERLIAYASQSPIDLTWSEQEMRLRYIEYLRRSLENATPGTPFYDGLAYRLFKELVAQGKLGNARSVEQQLTKSMASRFGSDQSPDAWISRAKYVGNFDQWASALPFFAGNYCFFRGELGRVSNDDISDSLSWFNASLEITLRSISISPLFFTEAIYLMWAAINRSILLHLTRGRPIPALCLFELLTDAKSGRNANFRGVKPELNVVLEAGSRLIPHLIIADDTQALERFHIGVDHALESANTDIESERTLQLLSALVNFLLQYKQGISNTLDMPDDPLTRTLDSLADIASTADSAIKELLASALGTLHPSIVDALYALAVAKHQAEELGDAIKLYKRVISLDSRHVDAVTNLSIIYLGRGNQQEAIKLIELSLEIDPDQPDVLNTYGSLLFGLNRFDKALNNFERAIALRPDYAEAHNNRGIALHNLNRPDEALSSFEHAISLKPDYAEAHNNRNLVQDKLKHRN